MQQASSKGNSNSGQHSISKGGIGAALVELRGLCPADIQLHCWIGNWHPSVLLEPAVLRHLSDITVHVFKHQLALEL
jgi:hypothetical protein